jgi:hypothetical protein
VPVGAVQEPLVPIQFQLHQLQRRAQVGTDYLLQLLDQL